jgi:prepilin-type N-terminal cleavage/methylation domain-containing protein
MRRRQSGRSRSEGFTLLEVMAAVAVLALVYTVLARTGILGLQHEGEAERRLQASLLADLKLEEIETALEAGTPPQVGEEESQVDDFVVVVSVSPFDLVLPEVEEPRKESRAGEPRRPGRSLRDVQQLGPSLLVGERGQPSPLRRIDVRVGWLEGFGERSVVRTTFGLDPVAAQEALAALDASAEAQSGSQPLEQGRGEPAQPPQGAPR